MNIQIDPQHLATIQKVIGRVSKNVFIFGSRAKGTAKPLSDLDVAIKGQIDPIALSKAREDLENSNIPFKVDIVLWDRIDESFKKHIEPDLRPLF